MVVRQAVLQDHHKASLMLCASLESASRPSSCMTTHHGSLQQQSCSDMQPRRTAANRPACCAAAGH